MSGLAKYLLLSHKKVGGYDDEFSEYTDELVNLGITVDNCVTDGLNFFDVFVYTDAIAKNHPILLCAKEMKKIIVGRGELLAEICKNFESVIAVSGCHGKTTCSAMIAHIFYLASEEFASHIGGKHPTLSNFYMNGNKTFITEACEYKKNFLKLKPTLALVLNTDADHMECYESEKELRECYKNFVKRAERSVTFYGDFENADVTFGFNGSATYCAKDISENGGMFSFKVYKEGSFLGSVALNVYGKHNILNALAAYAVCDLRALPNEKIIDGLNSFTGVERRFEYLGVYNRAACIADYAHHPKEIEATLKTAELICEGNLYVVFQPHTYSRTKNLFSDFVSALNNLKNLMIYRTFASREYYDDGGSAYTLSLALKNSRYGESETDIKDFLKGVKDSDKILFLGAGDIYGIAKSIINYDDK